MEPRNDIPKVSGLTLKEWRIDARSAYSGIDLFVYLSFCILICAALLQYSRMLTIFFPTIAFFSVAILLVGFLSILLIIGQKNFFRIFFILVITVLILLFSFSQFSNISGEASDIRTLGVFSGLFMLPVFYWMLLYRTPAKVVQFMFIISAIYCIIYCGASALLIARGSLGNAQIDNAILFDPRRGVRLFSNTVCIVSVLIFGWYNLLRWKRPILSFSLIGLGCFTLLMTQSRMAMLSALAMVLVILIKNKNMIRIFSITLPFLYFFTSLVAMFYLDNITEFLVSIDPDSLTLRSDSLYISSYIFERWPVIGIGYPLDPLAYNRIADRPFYPEDLGGIGLVSNYGVLGLGWISLVLLFVVRGVRAALQDEDTSPIGYVGLYVVLYGFTWPTFMYGDGTIFSALLISIGFWHTGRSTIRNFRSN